MIGMNRALPPLTASNLRKTYGNHTTALDGADLTVRSGESLAIMGPSGSGKTTLLHCLAGILLPTSGEVAWRGHSLASLRDAERTILRRTDFGFVFQSGHLLPELPCVENVALPLMLNGIARRDAVNQAMPLLQQFGLGGLEYRRPGELSGGQAQRAAIARALVTSPGVVFADEPTGALDQSTSADVMQVLTSATRAFGASLVVVTHDPNVARWCSRTIMMQDGKIVAEHRAPSGGTESLSTSAGNATANAPGSATANTAGNTTANASSNTAGKTTVSATTNTAGDAS